MPVRSKQTIQANINEEISNLSPGGVTPDDIRRNLIDVVDSVHILTSGNSIVAGNFSTFESKNTKVGELALNNQYVNGHEASGNTAVGYGVLMSNYTGERNTGNGAHSLGCNVYGDDNAAFGYSSLACNLDGSGNVGIGNYTLNKSKHGSHNIAIGNGAGYYIGENDSYQFYLGSHPVDQDLICNFPEGKSGIVPLLRGDTLNQRLAVGTNDLHDEATLQVNGNIAPSDSGNLGTPNYSWDKVYAKSLVGDTIQLAANIEPDVDSYRDIGSSGNAINNMFVNHLNVDGSASINDLVYNTIQESQYVDKTIYLASSGNNSNNNSPSAYLTDEGVDGAGFVVQSSGNSYRRNYHFIYRSPDTDLEHLDQDTVYSRSTWESNISLSTLPGRHIKTDRIIGHADLDLMNSDGYGAFLSDNSLFLGTESQKTTFDNGSYGGDINLYAQDNNFSFNLLNPNSGNVQYNMLTRFDGSNNIHGFRFQYVDENKATDRLMFTSHTGVFQPASNLVFMKDGSGFGYGPDASFLPDRTLDIAASNASIRVSGDVYSSLEVVSNSGGITVNSNGIISPVVPSSQITINAPISSYGYKILGDDSEYGQILSKENVSTGFQNLYFKDSNGTEHNLTAVEGDIYNSDFVYHDLSNVVAGSGFDRTSVNSSGNSIYGIRAGESITTGSNNILVGYKTANNITTESQNIVIGNNAGSDIDEDRVIEIGDRSNGEDPAIYGKMPESGNPGVIRINNNLHVHSYYDDQVISILPKESGGSIETNRGELSVSVSGDSIIDLYHNEGISRSATYHQESGRPITLVSSDLNVMGAINFYDGTYLESSSGIKNQPGSGIRYDYISETDTNVVNLDFNNLPQGNFNNNSLIAVESSGQVYKYGISELSQYLNSENPQVFYECADGYNLVLSNETFVDHTKNCSNIYVGQKAGDYATGYTNSLFAGLGAGQASKVTNPDLDIDVSALFIGYNAGRKSINADNSIFVGQSAGQNSVGCDNSIFIGNSTGQSSKSSKSIGIGDNTLESVDGENNIEIVGDKNSNNRLINGAMSNKLNVGGLVAGDTCCGRTSVGGAARVYPKAVLEVNCKHGDNDSNLQEWYDGNGNLAAYIDQGGNLYLRGNVVQESSYVSGTNKVIPDNYPCTDLDCGNTNSGGNTPPDLPINENENENNPGGPDSQIDPPQGYLLPYTVIFEEI